MKALLLSLVIGGSSALPGGGALVTYAIGGNSLEAPGMQVSGILQFDDQVVGPNYNGFMEADFIMLSLSLTNIPAWFATEASAVFDLDAVDFTGTVFVTDGTGKVSEFAPTVFDHPYYLLLGAGPHDDSVLLAPGGAVATIYWDLTLIPEPSTAWLFCVAGVGMLLRRRRAGRG